MNEIINGCQEIENKIYSVRGEYVMLDSDLIILMVLKI